MKILGLLLLVVLIYFNRNDYVKITNAKSEVIKVELKGLVKKPGTYTLKYLSKIEDLIHEGGGLLEGADDSLINYSKTLKNQDVIVIKEKQTVKLISLNSSSEEELCTIPGVGPATANRIIAYRDEVASFQTLEDIMLVKGIKQKLYDKMKAYISL